MSDRLTASATPPFRWFQCTVCGWVYDEARALPGRGIPPGTRWAQLPDGFLCSACGAGADWFRELAL